MRRESRDTDATKRYTAPALEKGLDILELLAEQSGGLTLTEISQQLDRSPTEIFRMVNVLHDRKYIESENSADGRGYRLSMKMYRLSHRFPPVQQLMLACEAEMANLSEILQQTCHLVIYSLGGGLLLSVHECTESVNRLSLPVGGTGPLVDNCAGHVLLSFSSIERREVMLDAAVKFRDDPGEVSPQLIDRVRLRGYETMDSPVIQGVTDTGAPIFDQSGEVIAVLMISNLLFKKPELNPNLNDIARHLVASAKRISAELGHISEGD